MKGIEFTNFIMVITLYCVFYTIMDNLHVRLMFALSKNNKIYHHSSKEHLEISNIAKFGCML